jgi:hypothetical protein
MRGKKISRYNRLAAVAAAYASHSEAATGSEIAVTDGATSEFMAYTNLWET